MTDRDPGNAQVPLELEAARAEIAALERAAAEAAANRQHLERALSLSEERYQVLTQDLQVGVLIQGPNAEILLSNPRALELLGLSEDQLLGKTSFDPTWNVIHEDGTDFPGPTHPVPESIATRRPVRNVVMGVFRPAGRDRVWLLVNADPKQAPDGSVRQVVCTFVDITARKRAEESLARQAHFFEQMFVQSGVSTQILDKDGWCERINPKLGELFGVASEAIEGRRYNVFEDEGVRQSGGLPHLRKVFERHEPAEWEVLFDLGLASESTSVAVTEKKKAWYWNRAYPILDANGRLEHVAVQHTDITERKRVEEALRESESLLREAQLVAGLGCYVLDVDAGTWRSSDALDAIFGIDGDYRHSFVGWTELVHPDDRAMMVEHFRTEVLGQGRRFDKDYRVIRPNDHVERWVHGLGTVVRDPATGQRSMHGTIQDVTAVKRAEEEKDRLEAQLRQAQKIESVGRLAGGVAHDFNNMLGVILGNTEMALEQVDHAQPLYADLLEIQKAARRSADLTRQLLAFARKQTVAPKVLSLNESLAAMMRMLQRLIGENIRLTVRAEAGLWPIKVDPSQVDQILANLCVNARDAIAGVGTLTLGTGNVTIDEAYCRSHAEARPGEFVQLTVRDDGRGMSAEVLEHLFEPFFTTKDVGKGTGLGLATVYGIVKQNDGFVEVQSEPGAGTTFAIYLPRVVSSPELRRGAEAAATAAAGRGTILLVEDEPAILTLAKRMLEKLGYAVLAASGPGEALRVAREHGSELDLLVTDVIMPEMNGRELATRLHTLHPKLRHLFISGYTADVIADQGVLEEGMEFLQKPFTQEELAAKVRQVLDREHATHER